MALHVPAAPCRQPLAQTHNPYLFHALADASSRAQFPGTSCGPLRAPSCLSKTFFQPRASNGVYERHGTYEERLHTTRTSAAPLQPFTYIQGQAFWWPSTPLTAAGRPACLPALRPPMRAITTATTQLESTAEENAAGPRGPTCRCRPPQRSAPRRRRPPQTRYIQTHEQMPPTPLTPRCHTHRPRA